LIGLSIRTYIPNWPIRFTSLPTQVELEAVRPGGKTYPLQVSVSEYLRATQGKLIVIIRDLTSSKQAEHERLVLVRQAEALRAQQMTTLAQLATGVAHEIRNPLTSIKMLIQVNRSSFAEAGLPTDDLELVEQEIRRMERSINCLLDYARPEKGEMKQLILQDLVKRTIQLIQGQCESQIIRISVEMPREPVEVNGDATQLHQLLLNLCLNAMDAMSFGGELGVAMLVNQANSNVELRVSDTGVGICDELRDRIFDPFVTTKSNGIGLGLGICRRIADAHNGTLEGANGTTGGAIFRLTLPLLCGGPHPQSFSTRSEAICKSC